MEEYVSGKNQLPKNVKQVGDIDADKIVYIEDYAYSFIKENMPDSDEEGRVGILLGEVYDGSRFGEESGTEVVFVKGAMEVTNASIFEGKVAFTDETWNIVKSSKAMHFPNLKTVGWYLVASGIKVSGNSNLERVHIDNFKSESLFFNINPEENQETVYSCFDGGLEEIDGYNIYYEKNPEMQSYMAYESKDRRGSVADENAGKRYRQYNRQSAKVEGKVKRQLSLTYGLASVLVIFILIVGVGRLRTAPTTEANDTKPGVNYVSPTIGVDATVAQVEDQTINVNFIPGQVEELTTEAPTTTEVATEEVTTQEVTTEEVTTEEPTTEEPTTAAPEYEIHVVKSGENLTTIVVQYYGTADRLKEVLAFNGITDGGNSINIDDEIKLPR